MKTPEGPEGASLLEHEATEDCEQSVVSKLFQILKLGAMLAKTLHLQLQCIMHAPNIRKCQEAMPMHAPE